MNIPSESDEHHIEEAVRRSIGQPPRDVSAEVVRANQRSILAEQESRFSPPEHVTTMRIDRFGTPIPAEPSLPPPAPTTMQRAKHPTPYGTRHSTIGPAARKPRDPNDDGSGE